MRHITAGGNPANQVVPVRRRERQDFDELRFGLARQRHQHEVRLHRLRGLFALIGLADLARDGPEVLAVVEHLGCVHVVQTVLGRLHLQ